MLPFEMPFPMSGSKGFERASARPLTILRRNASGELFCRRDDVSKPSAFLGRAGRASGNVTLPREEVVEHLIECDWRGTGFEGDRTLNGHPRQSRKARRPARAKAGAA